MAANDVGAHATPQGSHLTHPHDGGLGLARVRPVEWVCGNQYMAVVVKYIPLTPQALTLNINRQTSYPLLQANCWHVKTPRNASQDPETPPHTHTLHGPARSWDRAGWSFLKIMYSVR